MDVDPDETSNARVSVIAALVALSIAFLIGAAAWLVFDNDDDVSLSSEIDQPESAQSPESTEDPEPEEQDDPEPADPDDLVGAVPLDTVIDDMIAFVEQERGLKFKETPVVQTMDEDAFVEQLVEAQNKEFEENAEEQALFTRLYHLVGFLPEGVTIAEAANSLGTDGVLGYYETEDNELYIRGTEVTPFLRSVIVHELVHALDDQHFELFRPEYDDRPDEIGFGFSALVEGNARRVENAYVAGYSDEEDTAMFEEQLGFSYDLSMLSQEFLELQLAPYTAGEPYVASILADGGQEELDATFDSPATSSRAVLHPEQRDASPLKPEAPPADGKVLEEGVVGELALGLMLNSSVGIEAALDAADNLSGDWFVLWNDGEDLCLRAVFVGDATGDTEKLSEALNAWAADNDGEVSDDDSGNPILTVCG